MIGTVIGGSYRVERELGRGGFGIVCECTELELKRPVALKMLHPGATTERDLRRLTTEAENLAKLNHPNVVQIYRLGTHDGRPYIAMELVRGSSLARLIADGGLPTRRMVEIMRQVASGLAAVHGLGILHRDLSPNNIVVTESGTPKILDLGLAKTVGGLPSLESLDRVVGTLLYMSPEQIEGREIGFEAEIFSFGVILYEALTRVHPFGAEHNVSIFYNIAQRDPEPLSAHLTACPEALARLVSRCLAKSPRDRHASMTEVERGIADAMRSSAWSATTTRAIEAPHRPRATPQNPYLNRVMIKDRRDFFGRAHEVRRIYARLNATPPGSISIVGERKIGKSSLLNHVYNHASRMEHLEHPDRTVMVFLDLQQEKQMSMASFVRTLLGIASLELRGRVDVSDCALSLDGIRDMVQRLDAAGFRLAIVLDEFEAVTTNPNFSLEFFSFLRFLANHYNVAYITSSARDLQVLCHTKEISDSPFFNIFSTIRLSVFQRAEAEELIRVPSERVGKPLGPHAEAILEMAGLFPLFVQMACSHAIEYLDEHPGASEPDCSEVRRRFNEEARLHFRYIWDGFDPHEKSTALRVAQGRSLPDALKHVLTELEARRYVEVDGRRPRLFASTFDEFVKTVAARAGRRSFLARLLGRTNG